MKTNTKFTPGPWTCKPTGDRKRYIVGENQSAWGTDVGEVYSDDTDRDEAAANAALIQHAPELFAALAAAIDTLEEHADDERKFYGAEDKHGIAEAAEEVLRRAREAMALAAPSNTVVRDGPLGGRSL
jgi:hypothetical protein